MTTLSVNYRYEMYKSHLYIRYFHTCFVEKRLLKLGFGVSIMSFVVSVSYHKVADTNH